MSSRATGRSWSLGSRAGFDRSPSSTGRATDIALAVLLVLAVCMLLLPLPTALVDVLLSVQLSAAVALLLVSVQVRGLEHASAFPTLLLLTTFFRLALNISTTRLILAHGDAGQVVWSFGRFAVMDNLVVGVVLLLVIALVQLVVVTRGAERVAEVAARFSLDAMPGKQLAIDADVRAGVIDAGKAAERRKALEREARFYGAMDGAMRFVKGDALVAMAIVVINLVGGLIVGMGVHGWSASRTASLYLVLSIGDGLAAQIPALLFAVAAGLTITRATTARFDADRGRATGAAAGGPFVMPATMVAVGALFAGLALVPGLPAIPFFTTAVLATGIGVWLRLGAPRRGLDSVRHIAPITVELSRDVARRVDAIRPHGAFADQLRDVRRDLGRRLAGCVPVIAVQVADAARATSGAHAYGVRIRGVLLDQMQFSNAGAVTARDVVARMRRTIERYAFELVDVELVGEALDELAAGEPMLVRDAVPALVSRAQLSALVKQLVRGHIHIDDLAHVLRALIAIHASEGGARPGAGEHGLSARVDRLRGALAPHITAQYAHLRRLSAWRLDPFIEDTLRGALERDGSETYLTLEPDVAQDVCAAIDTAMYASGHGLAPDSPRVLLVAMDVRRFVAELIDIALPDVVVLSPHELTPDTVVTTMAVIGV